MYRLIALLLILLACAGCSTEAPSVNTEGLTVGDPAAGEVLFTNKIGSLQACNDCHTLTGTRSTGPSLQGFSEVAGNRLTGEDAQQYTANSIIAPGSYLVPGFANLMPGNYSTLLSSTQLSDLIAFLLTQ
ncbi:MAG: hypothetical protein IPK52_04625 [Chloroflexi bacterium]|nr:hypothetical protein [Chloroflexota bacterium]